MSYDLITPCKNCPFRTDIKPYITAGRVRSILTGQGEFHCHKTIARDDDGEPIETAGTKVCAGFLILLEKDGQPNQMMRIAERLSLYDPAKLRMDAPVYDSVADAIAAHRKGGK